MSAKVFVGDSACRDPNWLKISTELTEDILMSALAIRTFPKWALPVVSRLLPSLWRVKGHMREAKKIMRKSIDEYNEAKNNGRVPEDTILNYMLANGTEKETSVDFMAQVQGFLTSASIHTTASGIASCLFELCEHPEIITMLREELQEVISEHGALGAPDGIPIKQWFQKVEKMDSFILEVQRFHPTVFGMYHNCHGGEILRKNMDSLTDLCSYSWPNQSRSPACNTEGRIADPSWSHGQLGRSPYFHGSRIHP